MTMVTLDKNGLATASGTLTVYNFDSLTGEYTGTTNEYLAQGVGIPAGACTTAPPVSDTGRVAIYRDGSWQIINDRRGETVYSTSDGSAQLITAPGDYPAGTTRLAPTTGFDKWDGAKWVTDAGKQQAAAVQVVESEKAVRIAEANSITQAWQTQLMLGIITDADKASLTAWMKYVQDVQAVDIDAGQDTVWPKRPA